MTLGASAPLIAAVACGGAIGAVARLGVASAVTFPFGTLTANTLGSFAMGLLYVALDNSTALPKAFLMVGLLGAFTTFSSFALDALKLFEGGSQSAAAAYVIASVVLSLLGLIVGVMVMRAVL